MDDKDFEIYLIVREKLNYLVDKHGFEEIYGLLYDDIEGFRGE